jgi:hypothetical protein
MLFSTEISSRYYRVYKPKIFLFEGPDGRKYSAKSVHNIVKQSLKRAGIKKPASVHTLRHSFANSPIGKWNPICGTYRFCLAIAHRKQPKFMPTYLRSLWSRLKVQLIIWRLIFKCMADPSPSKKSISATLYQIIYARCVYLVVVRKLTLDRLTYE